MEMSEELLERFDKFVEGLGNLGEHTWEITVKQMFIDGLVNIGVASVMLILIGVVWIVAHYVRKSVEEHPSEVTQSDVRIGSFIVGGVISGILFVVMMGNLTIGVKRLANPEYYALQEVARMLGLN